MWPDHSLSCWACFIYAAWWRLQGEQQQRLAGFEPFMLYLLVLESCCFANLPLRWRPILQKWTSV
jgi:hypothetical protein